MNQSPNASGVTEGMRLPSARVLYAEADSAAIAFVRSTLEPEGWTLEVVGDGDRCLARFETGEPDVCLLDLALPDIAGLDLLPKIHTTDPEVPVIIVSASAAIEHVVAAMRLGASNYLAKPFDAPRLLSAVHSALQLVWQKRDIERLKSETGQGLAKVRINDILSDLIVNGGSDLHIKVGRRPLYRIEGDLKDSQFPALDEEAVEGILRQVLGNEGYKVLERDFEYDTAYVLPEVARCRVNAYRRMGRFAAAFRMIPLVIPTIESMGLSPVLKDICDAPQGMVLLTGPTGSGKSTSLAAMIDYLNETEALHILTIEDPIEFVYLDKKSTIDQRQLGSDTRTLHEALRRVLRQDPDIILLGEMRDRESIELAMHAAETGHLVFSTLHTNDAKQTLDRIVDTFPSEASHQIRAMLALTLHSVVSQRLVKRADGNGRVAAVEVMINSPNIRDLIAEGKTSQIEKAIASSGDYYQMRTFNQSLAKLALGGTISDEEALSCSTNPGDLKLMLKGISPASSSAGMKAVTGTPDPEATKVKITRKF
jgi:twitching motility protein PilT